MTINKKYFDPQIYYYKVLLICFFIIVDIIFNSFTQFMSWGYKEGKMNIHNDNQYLTIGIAFIQFLIMSVIIFVILSVFSETYYFKTGYISVICRNFKIHCLFLFLYPCVFVAERVIMGSLSKHIHNNNNCLDLDEEIISSSCDVYYLSRIKIWKEIAFLIIYVLKYIFAFIFYLTSLKICFE